MSFNREQPWAAVRGRIGGEYSLILAVYFSSGHMFQLQGLDETFWFCPRQIEDVSSHWRRHRKDALSWFLHLVQKDERVSLSDARFVWAYAVPSVLFCYSRNRSPAGDSRKRAATAGVRFLAREDEAWLIIFNKLCQFFLLEPVCGGLRDQLWASKLS